MLKQQIDYKKQELYSVAKLCSQLIEQDIQVTKYEFTDTGIDLNLHITVDKGIEFDGNGQVSFNTTQDSAEKHFFVQVKSCNGHKYKENGNLNSHGVIHIYKDEKTARYTPLNEDIENWVKSALPVLLFIVDLRKDNRTVINKNKEKDSVIKNNNKNPVIYWKYIDYTDLKSQQYFENEEGSLDFCNQKSRIRGERIFLKRLELEKFWEELDTISRNFRIRNRILPEFMDFVEFNKEWLELRKEILFLNSNNKIIKKKTNCELTSSEISDTNIDKYKIIKFSKKYDIEYRDHHNVIHSLFYTERRKIINYLLKPFNNLMENSKIEDDWNSYEVFENKINDFEEPLIFYFITHKGTKVTEDNKKFYVTIGERKIHCVQIRNFMGELFPWGDILEQFTDLGLMLCIDCKKLDYIVREPLHVEWFTAKNPVVIPVDNEPSICNVDCLELFANTDSMVKYSGTPEIVKADIILQREHY